ncbi:MAG TPA: DNA-binding response regulator, partial [Yinghuangia sp.]|nr:DNA-binding response regulator [Yinghuangia sp.]HSA50387.1 DNA-binding response regulator [Yinghuangia sp.]
MTPIRVFLLDDHEVVRRGLSDLLGAEPDIEVVGDSASAQEAI